MFKDSEIQFVGTNELSRQAPYNRLKSNKIYKVLAGMGDANSARSDGKLGAVILSDKLVVIEDEEGNLSQFSLNSAMFKVVLDAEPTEQIARWVERQNKVNPVFKPQRISGIETATIGEFSLAEASPSAMDFD